MKFKVENKENKIIAEFENCKDAFLFARTENIKNGSNYSVSKI